MIEYRSLGRTGAMVSPIALGTFNFGQSTDEDGARAIVRTALEHGINLFDVANSYNGGASESILGRALKEFAQRLRRNIRGVDLACRFGGEEFVVLMPDTDFRQAQGVAERVRMAVAERGFDTPEIRPLTVTCSVGVALNEHQADTPEMILKRADVALYRAKREGRNRVVFDAA